MGKLNTGKIRTLSLSKGADSKPVEAPVAEPV
jgi:hypothetical protein